jgi:hypothetical protein
VIEAELRRWVTEYQVQQEERIRSDVITYGSSTLRQDEVLEDLSDINFRQVGDTLFVNVTIKPQAAQDIPLSIPVITSA